MLLQERLAHQRSDEIRMRKAHTRYANALARMDKAEAKRARRNAKRVGGNPEIVLQNFPESSPGVARLLTIVDRPGAYIWGGNKAVEGRYQIVVVGGMRGTVDEYRLAAERRYPAIAPLEVIECTALPVAPGVNREFHSIILQGVV